MELFFFHSSCCNFSSNSAVVLNNNLWQKKTLPACCTVESIGPRPLFCSFTVSTDEVQVASLHFEGEMGHTGALTLTVKGVICRVRQFSGV